MLVYERTVATPHPAPHSLWGSVQGTSGCAKQRWPVPQGQKQNTHRDHLKPLENTDTYSWKTKRLMEPN